MYNIYTIHRLTMEIVYQHAIDIVYRLKIVSYWFTREIVYRLCIEILYTLIIYNIGLLSRL